jgi:hypothetical protein
MEATKAGCLAAEGTWVSRLFDYAEPRFGFKPYERELLWWKVHGYTDHEIERQVSAGPETLKKRWEAIYQRVADVDICLLPGHLGEARGHEKRRWLLDYLRDHPEELVPV